MKSVDSSFNLNRSDVCHSGLSIGNAMLSRYEVEAVRCVFLVYFSPHHLKLNSHAQTSSLRLDHFFTTIGSNRMVARKR
jgi:hypothetical protein